MIKPHYFVLAFFLLFLFPFTEPELTDIPPIVVPAPVYFNATAGVRIYDNSATFRVVIAQRA
jgi:hypothetical protein